jgi:hypothetical protein
MLRAIGPENAVFGLIIAFFSQGEVDVMVSGFPIIRVE